MTSQGQAQDAQLLYDHRASTYDDSWHPSFARHMVELAKLQPGEAVLDLACGTGLAAFAASETVGASGRVVGVDISEGMLAEAEAKKVNHSPANVELYQHSVTELDALSVVKESSFDAITCCSALVLLENPVAALRQWAKYLKPGGRLVVDVTHIQNLTSGVIMERVGRRLGRPLPWHRLNFESDDSLEMALQQAGLIDIRLLCLSQILRKGSGERLEDYVQDASEPRVLRQHAIEDADAIFDEQIDGVPMRAIASPPETRERARDLFREEWKKAAGSDGMVREVDALFVGVGFRPPS